MMMFDGMQAWQWQCLLLSVQEQIYFTFTLQLIFRLNSSKIVSSTRMYTIIMKVLEYKKTISLFEIILAELFINTGVMHSRVAT